MISNLLDKVYPFYASACLIGAGVISLFFGLSKRRTYKLLVITLTACAIIGALFLNIYSFNQRGDFSDYLFSFGSLQVLMTTLVLFAALNILLFISLNSFEKDDFIKIIIIFIWCIFCFTFFIPSSNFIMVFSSLIFLVIGIFHLVSSLNRGIQSKFLSEYSVKNNIIRFFLLSALSLLLIFLGYSLIFGSTDFKTFTQIIESDYKDSTLVKTGFFIILSGIYMFLGLVPLHSPYMKMQRRIEYSSMLIVWFLYIPAGVYMFLKLKDVLFYFLGGNNYYLIAALLVLSAACVLGGNIGAIKTTSIRRIFSFLVLPVMGIIILGFVQYGLGLIDAQIVLKHTMANLILIGIVYFPVITVFYAIEKSGETDALEKIRGFGRKNIYMGINITIILLAFGGLIGTYGYFTRIFIASPYINNFQAILKPDSSGGFAASLNIGSMLLTFVAWTFIAANIIRLLIIIFSKNHESAKIILTGNGRNSQDDFENKTGTNSINAPIPKFLYVYITFFTLIIIVSGILGIFEVLNINMNFFDFSILTLNL